MKLSFDEIQDHKQFEDLVVAYFENLNTLSNRAITEIRVEPTGVGTDGGRDILVHTRTKDMIPLFFKRKWVVQCKFHETHISTNQIADINIPTLIHSYKAVGYLLICKQKPTSKLTQLFERLEKECTFGYKYQVLSGERFISLLASSFNDNEPIIRQFFPEYYNFFIKNKKS
jgi:hypothetical protein